MDKKIKFFKLSAMALLAIGMFMFTACGDDDNNENGVISQKDYAEQYFSISNGTYRSGAMPSSTSNAAISGIVISSSAKAGGTTTIIITSDVEYDRFFVGVEGKSGYMEYVPTGTRAGSHSYRIPVTFGEKTPDKVVLEVKGQTMDGEITQAFRQPVSIENFGADIGVNSAKEIEGVWRYEFEEEDDMGTIREDYRFYNATSKLGDFSVDVYTVEDGGWDGAWNYQVEGQYKSQGSTLRFYFRRVRQRTNNGSWTGWTDKGSAGSISPKINWQDYYNTWNDFVDQAEGNVWECLINDARTEMQWRKLKVVEYNENGNTYNYDPDYPIRHLKKI